MIGIFDSGLGGLTAYKELHALLPAGDFVYFGDTGRFTHMMHCLRRLSAAH